MSTDGSIDALLIDLDGVIRHFDPDHEPMLCRQAGLPPGTIQAAAYDPDRLAALTTGRITKQEWLTDVGRAIGALDAALAFGRTPATVDEDVMSIVAEFRSTGRPVAILTNGTDEIPAETSALGLPDRVDRILNSAEIGHAKPAAEVYLAACAALDVAPDRTAFTDDGERQVAGAVAVAMPSHHFTGAASLRTWLGSLGVLTVP